MLPSFLLYILCYVLEKYSALDVGAVDLHLWKKTLYFVLLIVGKADRRQQIPHCVLLIYSLSAMGIQVWGEITAAFFAEPPPQPLLAIFLFLTLA